MMNQTLVESLTHHGSADTELAVKMAQSIKRALAQVRDLTRGLLPLGLAGGGLASALQELVERVRDQSKLDCTFAADEDCTLDDLFKETHVYRIAQEALNNALKHAHASKIRVTLQCKDRHILLTVADNGDGFEEHNAKGMGLRIMRHRAGLIGADLTFRHGPGGGTIIRCSINNPEVSHAEDD
jgi:signal transduction histidine kinase